MEFYCKRCDEYLTYETCPYCGSPCTDTLSMTAGLEDEEGLGMGEELDVSSLDGDDDDGGVDELDFEDSD